MSVCLMETADQQENAAIQRVVMASAKRRVALLRDLGVAERDIVKLAHSGRNGLTRYLRNNWPALTTQTVVSQEHSPPPTATQITTSSEATPHTTPISPASESSPMVTINTLDQPSTHTIEAQPAQSVSISDPKQITQT